MSAIIEKQRAKLIAKWSGDSETLLYISVLKNQLKTTVQSGKLRCLQVLLWQSRKCSHLAKRLSVCTRTWLLNCGPRLMV